jgi:NAD(P)-dependent dehydrogenase (short-subunit alcohol dehydrogenase family)
MHMTVQKPIGSEFTAASTTSGVSRGIDLSGKVAIVTGGYAGLGLETTRTLTAAGGTVIVSARDTAKASAALAGLERVEIEPMDLVTPTSINLFAEKFNASAVYSHACQQCGRHGTAEADADSLGIEHHFAIYHLGHFQLAGRVWNALRKTEGAHIVSLSAWTHRLSPVMFDDLNFENRECQPRLGYAQSKTANILMHVGYGS